MEQQRRSFFERPGSHEEHSSSSRLQHSGHRGRHEDASRAPRDQRGTRVGRGRCWMCDFGMGILASFLFMFGRGWGLHHDGDAAWHAVPREEDRGTSPRDDWQSGAGTAGFRDPLDLWLARPSGVLTAARRRTICQSKPVSEWCPRVLCELHRSFGYWLDPRITSRRNIECRVCRRLERFFESRRVNARYPRRRA